MNWKLEKSIEPDAAIEKIRAGDLEALEQFDTLTQALAARGNYCYTQHCTALCFYCGSISVLPVRFACHQSRAPSECRARAPITTPHTVHRL